MITTTNSAPLSTCLLMQLQRLKQTMSALTWQMWQRTSWIRIRSLPRISLWITLRCPRSVLTVMSPTSGQTVVNLTKRQFRQTHGTMTGPVSQPVSMFAVRWGDVNLTGARSYLINHTRSIWSKSWFSTFSPRQQTIKLDGLHLT